MHRIHSAKVSGFTFQRPKEFDLKRYDDDGRFGYGEGKHIRLRFRIEKEAGFHLLESPLSTDQKVVEREDAYEITAELPGVKPEDVEALVERAGRRAERAGHRP